MTDDTPAEARVTAPQDTPENLREAAQNLRMDQPCTGMKWRAADALDRYAALLAALATEDPAHAR